MSIEKEVVDFIKNKLDKDVNLNSKFSEIAEDSLELISLIMSFEDNFGIVIPDNESANFKVVKDVVDFLEEKKK